MSKMWMNSGMIYDQIDSNYKISNDLPVGIYNIQLTKTGFRLEKYTDKFIFTEKIYGLQENFINHVIKTYNYTKGNLGIIFNGVKGTGKTYTAKELVNKLNLPTIIVKNMGDDNQSMVEFLSSIEANCIFFLDEFEKNFNYNDPTILQIMDGVYNTEFRKIFLLTTNSLNINDNLLGRPSRIRYVKTFENLDLKIVNEYLDDNLEIPEARQELLEFIDSLTISTIDILKTIVNEVNIHGMEGLKTAKSFFNVMTDNYEYSCVAGSAYSDEIIQDKNKFSMENFFKAAERFSNSIPKSVVDDENNCTIEERKALNKYYKCCYHNFHNLSHCFISSSIKFSNLKVGDYFCCDKIVAIDKKLNVIVVKYTDNKFNYYWIKNPNNKSSLYHERNNNSFIV